MAHHFAALLLDLQSRGRGPRILRLIGPPARDAMRRRLEACHDTLDKVRGREDDAKFCGDFETRRRERLVEACCKTLGGGSVVRLEWHDESPQGALRLSVGYRGVRRLQLSAPERVLGLGQIAYHVLAQVPLAALARDALA